MSHWTPSNGLQQCVGGGPNNKTDIVKPQATARLLPEHGVICQYNAELQQAVPACLS